MATAKKVIKADVGDHVTVVIAGKTRTGLVVEWPESNSQFCIQWDDTGWTEWVPKSSIQDPRAVHKVKA